MNRANNLLILLFFGLSTMNFAAHNNDRYKAIVAAFDSEKSSFPKGFMSDNNDIAIIKEHKEKLKNKYDTYANSWTPALLKTLGIGFGLESILMGLRGIDLSMARASVPTNEQYQTPQHTRLLDKLMHPIAERLGLTLKITPFHTLTLPVPEGPEDSLFYYPRLLLSKIIFPIDEYMMEPLLEPAEQKLRQMYRQKSITAETRKLASVSILGTTSLIAAGISAYLFNKAAQYKNKIEKLDKEISRDEAMLKALEQ